MQHDMHMYFPIDDMQHEMHIVQYPIDDMQHDMHIQKTMKKQFETTLPDKLTDRELFKIANLQWITIPLLFLVVVQ